MKTFATVAADGLHLRAYPDRQSQDIDQLTRGDRLEEIGPPDGLWLCVRVIETKTGIGVGEEGWVDGSFVALTHEWHESGKPKVRSFVALTHEPEPVVITQDSPMKILHVAILVGVIFCVLLALYGCLPLLAADLPNLAITGKR